MKSIKVVSLLIIFAGSLALHACARSAAGQEKSKGNLATFDDFIAALETEGLPIEIGDRISQDFFTPVGQVVRTGDLDLQVFEFPSPTDAAAAGGSISADGGSIGTTMVTWVASPHFYQRDNLIVLYIGDDASTLEMLEDLLGAQIAGR